jgi:hypothetical protein
MYLYRSRLAHGDAPDFSGDVQTLGSAEAALMVLKEAVRTVIRQGLIEPQLIIDFRNC